MSFCGHGYKKHSALTMCFWKITFNDGAKHMSLAQPCCCMFDAKIEFAYFVYHVIHQKYILLPQWLSCNLLHIFQNTDIIWSTSYLILMWEWSCSKKNSVPWQVPWVVLWVFYTVLGVPCFQSTSFLNFYKYYNKVLYQDHIIMNLFHDQALVFIPL